MSERLLKTLRKSGAFQAEYEGSIPFTLIARLRVAAAGKRQPQQRLGVLDFPRPREGPTQPLRCFDVKTRRKVRAHLRPVIQNLRTNLHPKLESYRDSWCPELKLAPMPWRGRVDAHEM